jgi:predicted nuclease of predicted toxin-antitoxin system
VRLLLDKNITWDLRPYLLEHHEVISAGYLGWDKLPDDQLLARARNDFDALITCDQDILSDQAITGTDVAVIVLAAKTNGIKDLAPLIPRIVETLETIQRGQMVRIHAEP